MPIRPPALDDRGFNDLVSDMLRRVPAHTPEWTDLREGDPGRTLIDLFAWMGDTILYRANLIPERQRLAFLRLLGRPLRAAEPARGLVQVVIDDKAATDAVVLPRRHPVAKPVHFEFDSELVVLPVEGQAFVKRPPSDDERRGMGTLLSDLKELYGFSGDASPYVTTPVFAGGAARSGGFDIIANSIDNCLWFALLAPGPEEAVKQAVRHTLAGGDANRRMALSVGLAPFIEPAGTLEAVSSRSPIPHVWEISSSLGDGTSYLPLEVIEDGTEGLTQSGVTRLLLPGSDDFGAPSNDVLGFADAGVGDRPPRLDDPLLAARLVGWIRLRPQPSAGLSIWPVKWAGINSVGVTQRQSYGPRQIGTGTGLSGQELPLGETQIEAGSLILQVEQAEGLRTWRQVPDTAMAGPGELAYSLDSEAGTVRFGDGVNGAVPGVGRAIQAGYMRSGGGAAGNLPAGALKSTSAPPPAPRLKLIQPLPMTGGADAETIDVAERRIPAELRHAGRAVTRSDFVTLAGTTPGQAIGRVEVLERFKPQQRRSGLPGVVSVMVIPARQGIGQDMPRPDRPMLESVFRWLDPRRPVGTELYVIAPEYVPLGVSAAVELIDPSDRENVLAAVREAIRLHLWPLAPGGPAGQGWPLGRAVDDRLIETAIARVPGVRAIAPVRLFSLTNSGTWRPVTEDATGRAILPLRIWQLPDLASLAVGEGASAAEALNPATDTPGNGIAVPVVPELC
ncbi:putative baseplate assembly protein [Novosphingobium beihaiensis]|uniref:Baseplate assembly protein n=1 Tax=Novosphingobium beihaiensis TaxID=2930389 RepID=A0ABT0BN70_9SPHN|nr:putative baseplate assembly protein [Novosphingobium beihaiensis]MCJ2186497.1 putative baseplate assembly protein [Novosphingobium beihaiensis]